MAIVHNFVEKYDSAPMEKRVGIILDNYAIFTRLIDGFETDLVIDICDERAMARRRNIGNVGIRVQTSGISDITFNIVAERDEVEKAVSAGDYFTALKGVKDKSSYIRRIVTIYHLKNDYRIVNGRIGFLQPMDYQLYISYLLRTKPIQDLADEAGLSYDAYRTRIYRCRAMVKEYSVEAMSRHNGEIESIAA